MTKYIDADALLALYDPPPKGVNEWDNYTTTISTIRQNIIDAPAADVVEVVRCNDCAIPHNRWTGCPRMNGTIMEPDDYCSYGRRKEGE